MEIALRDEILADELGAENLAVLLDERAVRLGGKGQLREPGDRQRIEQPGQDAKRTITMTGRREVERAWLGPQAR